MQFSIAKINLRNWVGMSVNLFIGLAEFLLIARVFFDFIFTSASGSFFHWIHASTDVLLAPFRGLFGSAVPTPGTNWYVNWVALFAMAAYPLVLYAAVSLAAWMGQRRK